MLNTLAAKLVDRTNQPISPGLYYVPKGENKQIVDYSELLSVNVAAAGFRFMSSLGYGNILSEEMAKKIVRVVPADETYLRAKLSRLEGEASILRAHLPPESAPAPSEPHHFKGPVGRPL